MQQQSLWIWRKPHRPLPIPTLGSDVPVRRRPVRPAQSWRRLWVSPPQSEFKGVCFALQNIRTMESILEDDLITVPGQMYACLSFVSPTSRQKSDQLAMKIRGIFATEAECKSHIQKLQKMESVSVDIYVAPLYKWLPIPPDPTQVQDQHYQEQFLEELMSGYQESQEQAKQQFFERKKKVVEEGLDQHLDPSEVIPKIEENVHPAEQ